MKNFKELTAQLAEAQVSTSKYSWGTMKTVHDGSKTSYPLHPEHQAIVKRLRPSGEHAKAMYKDETGARVHVTREGDKVHFVSHKKSGSHKTTVDYKHFDEEVELSENAPFKKLEHAVAYATDKVKTHRDNLDGIEVYKHKAGGYDVNHTMNASGRNSLNKIGAKHLGTVYKDKPTNIKEEELKEYSMDDLHKDAAARLKKDIDTASDKRIADAKTPKKKEGFFHMVGRKQIAAVKGAIKGFKEQADLGDYSKRHTVVAHVSDNTGTPADGEKRAIEKKALSVLAATPKHAEKAAHKHFSDKGYKVHSVVAKAAPSMKKEEVELEEGVFTDDEGIAKKLVAKHGKNVQSHDIKLALHMHPEGHKTTVDRVAGHVKRMLSVKEEVEIEESAPAKNTDVADKTWLKDAGKKPSVKSDLKNFSRFITGKKETNEEVEIEEARLFASHQEASAAAKPGQKPKLDPNTNKYVLVSENKGLDVSKVAHAGDKPHEEEWVDAKKKKETPPFDPDPKSSFKKPKNPNRTGMDAAKALAQRGMKEDTEEEGTMKSYKDFINEIKLADLPRRTVKGTSYGAQYHDPEGDDDADDKKPAKAADAPKRGRGRPAGAMSGARQKGSAKQSKTGGVDYTGYKLHLPNSNK
jgi:hypothetical protein